MLNYSDNTKKFFHYGKFQTYTVIERNPHSLKYMVFDL